MTEEGRRQHVRYNVHWSCRLLLPNKTMLAARVKNISIGGVGLEVPQMLPVGQHLSIEIRPMVQGESYLVRAKAQVTFSMIMGGDGGYSKGLKFILVPDAHKKDLSAVIKRLASGK